MERLADFSPQLLNLILFSTGTGAIIIKIRTYYDIKFMHNWTHTFWSSRHNNKVPYVLRYEIYAQLNAHILILHYSSFCSTAVLLKTCFEILPYKDKKLKKTCGILPTAWISADGRTM